MFGKENQCRLTPAEVEQKASALLSQMTLKEKVWLLNGNWDALLIMINGKFFKGSGALLRAIKNKATRKRVARRRTGMV